MHTNDLVEEVDDKQGKGQNELKVSKDVWERQLYAPSLPGS